MPSKLRQAIGLVKDRTSISLAKVSNTSNLEVAILKATTHEEIPVEDRYINQILLLTSSNKVYAAACARALSKRIGRTRNWIVALKSLMIVLRVLQDGDPYFPRDVLLIMKRGHKILNLSNFRDDYNSSPWDYTAFIRTFALYLSGRLECFLTGKLQRRMVMKEREHFHYEPQKQRFNERVRDMKPDVLLDKVTHWQRLLDRAMGTRPTGAAKTNRLVKIALYAIVRETFDLYRDISDGLALILDSFFHLPHTLCLKAVEACVRSNCQFDELESFYDLCKDIRVGRSSEYPSIQKISEEVLDTLQEYYKDHTNPRRALTSPQLRLPAPLHPDGTGLGNRRTYSEQFETLSTADAEIGSVAGSEIHDRQVRGMSLEDLINITDAGAAPTFFPFRERRSARLQSSSSIEDFLSVDTAETSPDLSIERKSDCIAKTYTIDDLLGMDAGTTSPPTMPSNQNAQEADQPSVSGNDGGNSREDWEIVLGFFDDPIQSQNEPNAIADGVAKVEEWELVLAETANNISSSSTMETTAIDPFEPFEQNAIVPFEPYEQNAIVPYDELSPNNNPFLSQGNELALVSSPAALPYSVLSSYQATPTFCAQNPNETRENDIFNSPRCIVPPSSQASPMVFEQQLWLQTQNGIIAKHISS